MLAYSMTNIQKYPEKDKSDMTIEAMKLALEALEKCMYPQLKQLNAIIALRDAIAEAEKQEPVTLEWDEVFDAAAAAYCRSEASRKALRLCFQSRDQATQISIGWTAKELMAFAKTVAYLYTTPQPQREWVGLTVEDAVLAEREACARVCDQFIDEMQKVLPVEKLRETDPYKAFYKANAARIIQDTIRARANT